MCPGSRRTRGRVRWSSNGPTGSRTDSERGRSSFPLIVSVRLSGTRSRARTTCPPHREDKSANTRSVSSDPYPVCPAELDSLLSTVSEMLPLRSTRCRAPRDAHIRRRANLPLRHCGVAVAVYVVRDIRRGKRERFDAREELCDDFCEKLPGHAGRQRTRRTPQFIRHETDRETPRIRIHFAQKFLPTPLLETPYRSPDPNPRSPPLHL